MSHGTGAIDCLWTASALLASLKTALDSSESRVTCDQLFEGLSDCGNIQCVNVLLRSNPKQPNHERELTNDRYLCDSTFKDWATTDTYVCI